MSQNYLKVLGTIDTVQGNCSHCGEETILVAVIKDYYRCTNCGEDTKQHVNGRIRYMQLSDSDIKYIKDNLKDDGKTKIY